MDRKTKIGLAAVTVATVLGAVGATAFAGHRAPAPVVTASFVRPKFDLGPALSPAPDATPVSAVAPELAKPPPLLNLERKWNRKELANFAKLSRDAEICRAGLDAVGVKYSVAPSKVDSNGCGYVNAVTLKSSRDTNGDPMVMTCETAARFYLWQIQVVAPAAEKYLGSPVEDVVSLGTFSCRNVAGTEKRSKHGSAQAIDVSGFRLADGRFVSVLHDYFDEGPEGEFLRTIHDGACGVFDVTLGPNYNADHANHFHIDTGGDRACH
jgi:hypothetical protein